ncbi:MAG: hypothetical protein ACYC6G_19510 [Desulfobaccales bacterium]
MDENQRTTGLEVSKPLSLAIEAGKTLCKDCRELEALRESIEENTRPEDLIVLLDKATWPLKSLCKLLDVAEHDELVTVLEPLLERLSADLEKINTVISRSLGEVQISVCDHHMEIDGKTYYADDFFQAVLEPKEPRH